MPAILISLIYLIVIVFLTIYGYFWYYYKYWSKKNIPYLNPKFPYGNLQNLLCKVRGYNLELMELYSDMRRKNMKFGGLWTAANPVLMITDPDYAKDILTKDFAYFVDRGMYYNKTDRLGHSLFLVDETKWRNIRTHLTPTFTSGKMKMMFPLLIKASESMIEAIEKVIDNNDDIDIKEFLAKFTTDVIVSCAYGIEANSFTDANHPFRNVGKNIFGEPGFFESVKFSLMNYAPSLCHLLGLPSLRKEATDFFYNIIKKTVNYRLDNKVNRDDFLQLVMDMVENTKNTENPFTFEELIAQVNLFFIAGFDTSSSAMNFALYELARRPDLQEKLRSEINLILKKHNGVLSYEAVSEMKYLHQVVEETLRIYPSVPILQRRCVKNYAIRNTNIMLDKGTYVVIPIISIHRDPEYYSNPLVFDPDRFSPENRSNNCYVPFGDGPRNCIGLRFGLMQTKIGIIQILKRSKLSISPSTKMPLQLNKRSFLLKTIETLYLKGTKI